MEQEVSSGGIVFRRHPQGVQFAVMLDSYGKWTFPKGHVEGGETLAEAAARETIEELGLESIRLLESLGQIDIWFRDRFTKPGRLVHKDIHFFLFEAPPGSFLHPNPAEHVYKARWTLADDILRISSYSDMVPIIKKALSYIQNRSGG